MFNKNKFRAKVVENGFTIKQIAEMLHISEVTLYRKINGISDFTRKEIQKLKEILKLDTKAVEEIFFAE
jgi:predicted transcriptional regulator